MIQKSLTTVCLLACVLAVHPRESDRLTPADLKYRKVGLLELRDLAKGRPRTNIQMKITWCAEQTKPILTRTLGTLGFRLGMKKFTPLRRPGWHYGNDGLHGGRFFQITAGEWRNLIDALRGSPHARRINPKKPPAKQGFHVILCWTSWNERDVRWCELFTGPDDPELRKLIASSIASTHPAHEEFRKSILRGY